MSTVAGAVVTIDGDSSGLVGALQKGEKAISGVKAESRKLSDQLKEVVDDADKAAGALVQKIGGPTAIKAMAGIGVAATAAKELVGAFMESSEKLFQSYGEEGKRVWEETEKGLFAVKGAFAEALLGGRDLNENAARMNALLATTKAALDLLLSPLRLLADAMWALSDNTRNQTAYQRDLVEIEEKYKVAVDQTRTSLIDTNKSYEDLTKTLGNMLRSRQEEAAIRLQMLLLEIDTQRTANQEAKDYRANADADARAALVRADLLQSGLASKLEAAEHELTVVNDGVKQSNEEIVARAREMLEADVTFQRALYANQAAARQQAYAESTKMTEEERQREAELLTQRENLIQAYEELRTFGEGGGARPSTSAPSAVDSKAKSAEEAARAAAAGLAGIVKSSATDVAQGIIDIQDATAKFYEMTGMANPHEAHLFSDIVDGIGAAKTAVEEGLAAINAGREADKAKAKAAADQEVEDEKARKALLFDLAVTQNAKMLANAIVAHKSMADVARSAIGNVVSALGDKAMVEAGEAAVAGNFAQATGYAAVGTTMYTVAAALGAQKKPNAGPPTERQQPVQNYAYNLRIDAAFADSESISRRFAQMQEGARQRGLIAGAA